MIRFVGFLLCIFLFCDASGMDREKNLQELQEKIKACGSNIQCIAEALQSVNLEGNAANLSEFLPTLGESMGRPWMLLQKQCRLHTNNPMFSCLPVTVTVFDAVDEQAWDDIPSGILPHSGTKYLTLKKAFSYSAEGKGRLFFTNDFSTFSLDAAGTPETTRVREFNGYEQWYELVDAHAKRVLKRRDFVTSGSTIHTPFTFQLTYPFTADTLRRQATKNFEFHPVHVLTHDKSGIDQIGSELPDEEVKEQMVTPSMMRQIVATKGFQRTYRWSVTQPYGMQRHLLTIKVVIDEGAELVSSKSEGKELFPGATTKPKPNSCREAESGKRITLAIVIPQNEERFSCNEKHPVELIVEALAIADPPQYADQIAWAADGIGNAAPSFHPSLNGYKTSILYEGLPGQLRIGEYGPYTITASVNSDECVAAAATSFYYYYGDCCAAKADIEETMKLINAFKDPALLQKAQEQDWSAITYREQVYEQALGAPEGYDSPMETDPFSCNVQYNWSRQDYKDKGHPDFSFEADDVHEQYHRSSCQEKTSKRPTAYDAYISFPKNLSQEEIGAYTEKLKYLKRWGANNCR